MSTLDPLARAFLVVDVIHDETGAPSPRLRFSATYGADGGDGASDDSDLVGVAASKHFCFPEYVPSDLTSILPAERARPEQYTFSLTESDGSRTTGYCRRFLLPAWAPGTPSSRASSPAERRGSPFSSNTSSARRNTSNPSSPATPRPPTRASSSSPVAAYLRALCARLSHPPARSSRSPLRWHRVGTGFPSEAFFLPRAPRSRADGHDPDVRFARLMFQGVTVHATVALFAAVFRTSRGDKRRRLIAPSPPPCISGGFVVSHGAAYLPPPHPEAFVEYLTAPMPFLVELPTSLLPAMRALPTEEVFHLNLDGGEYTYFPEDLDALPTRPTRALQSALEAQMRSVRHDESHRRRVSKIFLRGIGAVPAVRDERGARTAEPTPSPPAARWLDQDAFEAARDQTHARDAPSRARNHASVPVTRANVWRR